MRLLLSLPACLLLTACTTTNDPSTPTPEQASPAGELLGEFSENTTRAASAQVQRAMPRTGFWPIDRLLRETTTSARRTVEDQVGGDAP